MTSLHIAPRVVFLVLLFVFLSACDGGGGAGIPGEDGTDDVIPAGGGDVVPGLDTAGSSDVPGEESVWTDPVTGHTWQVAVEGTTYVYYDADSYCEFLTLAGFSDWRNPSIDELRSLVRGCPSLETGGSCGLTDGCSDYDCDDGCDGCPAGGGPAEGCYWPPELSGECDEHYWTSVDAPEYDGYRWAISFDTATTVNLSEGDNGCLVRCVR